MSLIADWLVRQAPAWLTGPPTRPLTPAQRRALHAILRCRTPALGGHVYRCGACEETDFAYHSCHHRACPRCGGAGTAAWTARQTARLLPVPYFLATCTMPEELRPIVAARPELLHALFFRETAKALQTIAGIPRHLGADVARQRGDGRASGATRSAAQGEKRGCPLRGRRDEQLGMVGVLHTWGRQLQLHPHIHYIIPGGGLAPHGTWRAARCADWLLPGDAVAAAVRAGMDEALRHAAPDLHAQVPARVWRAGWWVHWLPAGTGENVVKYRARYVHRTAITDERILAADDEHVTFCYTDTATQTRKECTLTADDGARQRGEGEARSEAEGEANGCPHGGRGAEQFMRRYLQHVPPPGSTACGILAGCIRPRRRVA